MELVPLEEHFAWAAIAVSSSAPDVATAINQFRSHSDAADGIAGAGRWKDVSVTKVEVHLPGPQFVLHPHSIGSSDQVKGITREARGFVVRNCGELGVSIRLNSWPKQRLFPIPHQ